MLGAGAGGGVPQWNCGCDNCTLARRGDPRVLPRTQDSIAISGNDEAWLLVNASPDVLRQIERTPVLHPRARRDTPIAAVALTNGDLDHVTGLLSLRESQPFTVLATEAVRAGLVDRNVMLRTLARSADHVRWEPLELGVETLVPAVGLGVTAFAMKGKPPVHLMGVAPPSLEDNVALRVRDVATGRALVLATALGGLDGLVDLLRGAEGVLLDGTFWSEDELVAGGLGRAHARDMAHVPIGGPLGSLEHLAGVPAMPWVRVYTHINNSNPVLRQGSAERTAVERAGWQVAFDGMEIVL